MAGVGHGDAHCPAVAGDVVGVGVGVDVGIGVGVSATAVGDGVGVARRPMTSRTVVTGDAAHPPPRPRTLTR